MEDYIIVELQDLLSNADGVWVFAGATSDGKAVEVITNEDRGRAILDCLFEDERLPLDFKRYQVVPAGTLQALA